MRMRTSGIRTFSLAAAACAVLMLGTISTAAQNEPAADASALRTITDMAGRKVAIPQTITRALSTSPPPTTYIYMLAPEKLGGWTGALSADSKKFIPKEYHGIPVVGWARSATRYEAFIAARPDLVFAGCASGAGTSQADLTQEKFGSIPVVCVGETRNALEYGATLTFMGEVLGVPERTARLVSYYQKVLEEVQGKVAAIPASKRTRVYYAEGNGGLTTDPSGSVHSQLIDICGGINVAECAVNSGSGTTPVTMESVLMWNPDLIITTSSEFISNAYQDDSWQRIPAVKNHRVYLTPRTPFNWFDRPPGVNRIVGIPWTAHLLYPEHFPEEWFSAKAKEFYSIFYHYPLSDEELAAFQNR